MAGATLFSRLWGNSGVIVGPTDPDGLERRILTMPLQGKFLVNNERLAPLVIYGVGTFMAFSGNNIYRNRGGCTAVPENGPIPASKYWIIDRPAGGICSQMKAWNTDMANTLIGKPSNHNEWFALYRDDGRIDDYTWFQRIRHALLHTTTLPARNSGLNAYGW